MRFLLVLLSLFFFVKPALAGEAPVQNSPNDNSAVSSSSLSWQTPAYSLYPTKPYRVQIDDDSAFSSVNKDYYTGNTYYTPVLSLGTWYWRVRVKDSGTNWSDWSSIRSFILTDAAPTPSPAAVSTPTPTSNSTPTPTHTASPSPASTPKKTATPTSAPTPKPTATSTQTPVPTPIQSEPVAISKNTSSPAAKRIIRIASVAAATAEGSKSASFSGTSEVKDQKQINSLVWIGLIFVFAGGSSIGYIYLKRNGKIPFRF